MEHKRKPNRLIKQKSPYLIQHAYNPIDWYPWSDEAFEKARTEDKPVFLSIGYSTCHWCHVRESNTFVANANVIIHKNSRISRYFLFCQIRFQMQISMV